MRTLLRFDSPSPPDRIALAQDAFNQGQAALAAGVPDHAIRCLDRACRLLPDDATLMLALAGACVGHDKHRARSLFTRITERWSVREAWLGLAATSHSLGDHQGAARALGFALRRFVLQPTLEPLADAITRDAGAAGWCGVSQGRLLIRLTDGHGDAELQHDGCPPVRVASGSYGLEPRQLRAFRLTARSGRAHLLGSPLELAAIRRSEGFVTGRDGGLAGWLWHPGDPDADPAFGIQPLRGGPVLRLTATEPASLPASYGFLRARQFHVPAERLKSMPGLLRVFGSDGNDLLGSPLDPEWERTNATRGAMQVAARFPAGRAPPPAAPPPDILAIPADLAAPPARVGRVRQRDVSVIIPVHGAAEATRACLDTVLATVRAPSRIVVVDDASPDPDLRAMLDDLARRRTIRLIRHARPLGFPASANGGMLACQGRDIVLLNSDTLVPPGWLQRLRAAAYQASDIGTATPLSNNASIVSYPGPPPGNLPERAETNRLSRLAHKANAGHIVDIPVAVGFCMYIRRDCLAAVGLFRTDCFAQGYGDENDFCLRARHLGWRHVAATDVFVAHAGGGSFGGASAALQERNQALLNRLHPGYDRLIAEWIAADPLAGAFRNLDLARWRAQAGGETKSVIMITHNDGGGVERRVAESCRAHRAAGRRPIVLRPGRGTDQHPAVLVDDGSASDYPHLRYRIPQESDALLHFLRANDPVQLELHHVLGHSPAIYDLIATLALPYDVHVHDWIWICPRVILIGPDRRYCGEPDATTCDACVADGGSATEEEISVKTIRQRSARLLSGAQHVLVSSYDAAARLRRHFPDLERVCSKLKQTRSSLLGLRARFTLSDVSASSDRAPAPIVVFPEDDEALPPLDPPRSGELIRVCVIGAISVAKGYDVLLACARDAARRNLPLQFVVVGHTVDDARLLATGRVFVTGEFRHHEAVDLIRSQNANLALLPAIWPETWCYALSDAWRAGLRVVAFNIGAPAERIRRTKRGVLLPVGSTASAINDALLAASSFSRHECTP